MNTKFVSLFQRLSYFHIAGNEHCFSVFKYFYCDDESKTLEESLIKCADTIQYLRIFWEPLTKSLLYLVNLEIKSHSDTNWKYLLINF